MERPRRSERHAGTFQDLRAVSRRAILLPGSLLPAPWTRATDQRGTRATDQRADPAMAARIPSRTVLFCLSLVVLPVSVRATPRYTTETLKEAVPVGVSGEVRACLERVALRVLDRKGRPFADLWLRRSLRLQKAREEPGVEYGQIPEGSLLGIIRLHARGGDFRGGLFKAGVFTMRLATQPQDGDHLGVSDTRDFILLSPVKVDTKTKALSTKEVTRLSVQASGRKHPLILYLIKLYDKASKLPRIVEMEDLEYWVLDCEIRGAPTAKTAGSTSSAPVGGGETTTSAATPLRLSIVIEGEAEEA